MLNKSNENNKYINKVAKIAKCLAFSYVFTLVVLFICAIIITYTGVDESMSELTAKCITYISAALCGFLCSHNTNEHGWLSGAVAGFFYSLCIVLINIIANGFSLNVNMLLTLTGATVSGIIGGIAGINIKRKPTKSKHKY